MRGKLNTNFAAHLVFLRDHLRVNCLRMICNNLYWHLQTLYNLPRRLITVSILLVWKANRKGKGNGFKIAPPSSGRGNLNFCAWFASKQCTKIEQTAD